LRGDAGYFVGGLRGPREPRAAHVTAYRCAASAARSIPPAPIAPRGKPPGVHLVARRQRGRGAWCAPNRGWARLTDWPGIRRKPCAPAEIRLCAWVGHDATGGSDFSRLVREGLNTLKATRELGPSLVKDLTSGFTRQSVLSTPGIRTANPYETRGRHFNLA
jgi:hypothetical protein